MVRALTHIIIISVVFAVFGCLGDEAEDRAEVRRQLDELRLTMEAKRHTDTLNSRISAVEANVAADMRQRLSDANAEKQRAEAALQAEASKNTQLQIASMMRQGGGGIVWLLGVALVVAVAVLAISLLMVIRSSAGRQIVYMTDSVESIKLIESINGDQRRVTR
jgi:hypothetical protein